MREHRDYITCAVATANGFAMPYRARPAPQADEDESTGKDSASAARRQPLPIYGPPSPKRSNAKA